MKKAKGKREKGKYSWPQSEKPTRVKVSSPDSPYHNVEKDVA